jgi:hypothetical protein
MLQETSKNSNKIVPQGNHQRSKHETDVHNATPLAMRGKAARLSSLLFNFPTI